MKILVISDTHGNICKVVNIINSISGITDIIHLGDYTDDADKIQFAFPNINVIKIRGNNDFCTSPTELLLDMCGYKILAVHGHKYSVKFTLKRLVNRALMRGANVVLFGHTHKKYDGYKQGVRLINPSNNGYALIQNNGIGVKTF